MANAGVEIIKGASPYMAFGNSIFIFIEVALIMHRAAPTANKKYKSEECTEEKVTFTRNYVKFN